MISQHRFTDEEAKNHTSAALPKYAKFCTTSIFDQDKLYKMNEAMSDSIKKIRNDKQCCCHETLISFFCYDNSLEVEKSIILYASIARRKKST